MKTYKHIVLILSTVLLFSTCKKEGTNQCFKSIGEVNVEQRELAPFTAINLEDQINLILTQDTFTRVEVETGINLLPYVRTRVEGDTLHIFNENRCNWLRTYQHQIKVYVTLPDLKELTYSGQGNISTTDTFFVDDILLQQWGGTGTVQLLLNTDSCNLIVHTGTGNFEISGRSNYLFLYSSGYAPMDCSKFLTQITEAGNRSIGDFFVNATNRLVVHIESQGSVFYIGNPTTIDATITGKGKLVEIKK